MKDLVIAMNMQRGYFEPEGCSYLGDSMGPPVSARIRDYLSHLDRRFFDVIITRELRSVEDSFFANQSTVNYVGTKDIELVTGFQQLCDVVVNTCRPSALANSFLLPELKKRDIGRVILVGAETHSSICFTAADLRFRGYIVTVPEPLVVSRDEYLHNFAITLLTSELGIDVTKNA